MTFMSKQIYSDLNIQHICYAGDLSMCNSSDIHMMFSFLHFKKQISRVFPNDSTYPKQWTSSLKVYFLGPIQMHPSQVVIFIVYFSNTWLNRLHLVVLLISFLPKGQLKVPQLNPLSHTNVNGLYKLRCHEERAD